MSEYNTYMNMVPVNPAVEAVKKTGGSVVFLIATITYTLMALLAIIELFVPTALPYADLLYEMTDDYSVYSAATAASGANIIVSLIAMAPTILGVIGLWLIFSACKSRNPRISTSGFSIMSGVMITRLVCMCILLALVVICMLIFSIAFGQVATYSSYGWMDSLDESAGFAMGLLIAVFALLILICVLFIIYYVKAVGCARSAKKAANGIVPGKSISMFVIVISFMVAGFGLINLLTSLLASFSVLSFLSDLCDITFYALIGVVLIQLRGQLNRIAAENAGTMGNTMGGGTGGYGNFNTGSYQNFNTGSVPPVQPQYGQQTYGQSQQTGGYQYQQTGGYQYQPPQGQPYEPQQPPYQQPMQQQDSQQPSPWNDQQ